MILFLDFDGVLHPENVYLTKNGPTLIGEGHLLMWSAVLVEILAPFPAVELVLSTSWVRQIGFSRTKKRLPQALQERVVGATWHTGMSKTWAGQGWWEESTRYGQIMKYAARNKTSNWLAVDDDIEGWSPSQFHRLIHTDGSNGLSDEAKVSELQYKLRAVCT
jgi:hypothetical protein